MSNEHTAGSPDTPLDFHISGIVSGEDIDEIRADIFTLAGKIGQVGRLGAMEILIGDQVGEARARQKQEQIAREALGRLTSRELQVSEFLAEGLTNARIASELGVSENAVKHHVHAILTKTGTKTRTAAAVLILEGRAALGGEPELETA